MPHLNLVLTTLGYALQRTWFRKIMCGIVGFHSSYEVNIGELLFKMQSPIHHRGPDAGGEYLLHEEKLALGHQRLSILDLTDAGRQPLIDERTGLVIVFNGEIYNYQELRKSLVGLGHSFRTGTDTEVLLFAYKQWGSASLQKLKGMFAFAIYDPASKILFCARDPVGEKPFYYHLSQHFFAFASECKSIFKLPSCHPQIDYGGLRQYLTYGYANGTETLTRQIKKLQPGHTLTYKLGSRTLKISPYRKPQPDSRDQITDKNTAADHLSELLHNGIKSQLVADVPVGVLLSGGVDSSLVAAIASRVSTKPIKTFTAIFPGSGTFDEATHARRIAEYIGADHTELVVEPQSVDVIEKLAFQFDEPIADSSMVPTYLVSSLIRTNATVALGGDGADELFGGYPYHRWLQRIEWYRRLMPRFARKITNALVESTIPLGVRGRNLLLAFLNDSHDAINKFNVYFDNNLHASLLKPEVARHLRDHIDEPNLRYSYAIQEFATPNNAPLVDFLTYLPNNILTKVDRASMLTSLEVRSPWLSRDIVDFSCNQIPLSLKCTSTEVKILPKILAKNLLPDSFDLHRKQGFSIPLHLWFSTGWGEFFKSVLLDPDSRLINTAAAAKMLNTTTMASANVQRLFSLTILELWARKYRIGL